MFTHVENDPNASNEYKTHKDPYKHLNATDNKGGYKGGYKGGNNKGGYKGSNNSTKPIVDLQVYEAPKPPRKPRPEFDPALFLPNIISNPMMMGYGQPQQTVPLIKNYNINVSGPVTKHGKVNQIYEDYLPGEVYRHTSETLKERLQLMHFIRSTFIKRHDGEYIDLSCRSGQSSIMSSLKFMTINPYNAYYTSNNPYKGLPNNFLIYNSCYPIRYDKYSTSVKCAKESVGMNVRIYNLSHDEIEPTDAIKSISRVWREVELYYTYIRDFIIKTSICPHFCMLFCYFISESSGINFPEVNKLTDGNLIKDISSGSVLVSLTEAQTYNIYDWSRRTYEKHGNINKMTRTGYHENKVWFSIMFQILYTFCVMQEHNLSFDTFKVERQVFIKDLLSKKGGMDTYWTYIVDGFKYYVPNRGYIAMIDSGFFSNIVRDDSAKSHIKKHALEFFNPNIFSNAFKNIGGLEPPPDVLSLMTSINSDILALPVNDLKPILHHHFRMMLNNRIGTPLLEGEHKYLHDEEAPSFKRGEIMLFMESFDNYKFAMYENDGLDDKYFILRDRSSIPVSVPKSNCRKYLDVHNIVQEPASGLTFTPDTNKETYVLLSK